MKMFPTTVAVKHVIRPDGTIRVATSAPVQIEEGELVVEREALHMPGEWLYDFVTGALVELTPAQRRDRTQQREKAGKERLGGVKAKRARFKQLLQTQTPEQQELFELLATLSGIQL